MSGKRVSANVVYAHRLGEVMICTRRLAGAGYEKLRIELNGIQLEGLYPAVDYDWLMMMIKVTSSTIISACSYFTLSLIV